MRRSIGIDMIYIKRIRVSTLSLRDHSSVKTHFGAFFDQFFYSLCRFRANVTKCYRIDIN